MKINQFAYINVSEQQALAELKAIHMIDDQTEQLAPVAALKVLMQHATPEVTTKVALVDKFSNLMLTPTMDLATLTESTPLTARMLHNLALQLSAFEVGLDFELADPEKAMTKIGLPLLAEPADEALTTHELLIAWYRLLNMRTKLGQTILDNLAGRGYFSAFYDDPSVAGPLLFNGKTQPIFNPHETRNDVVYVESPQDTDHDGQRDLLKVVIMRPAATDNGLKVPVLYTASPYNQGTNDEAGEKLTHNVNVPLTEKPTIVHFDTVQPERQVPAPRPEAPQTTEAEEYFAVEPAYTLNDYFLSRGYAIVYTAGIGTKDSDGVRTTGDIEETISTTAVIKWLNGDLPAFTNRAATHTIDAWWSNHQIGMTGRSYLGTLATAAATTGVDGLKTIVAEAAISNWYDYYREGGLVIAPGGFQGEDADVLAEETFSREQQAGAYHRIKDTWQNQLKQITTGQDRETGNYNAFWDARNYLHDMNQVKADVLLVHGLNDWNVKPKNAWNTWNALLGNGQRPKMVLHQGQHIYINNYRSLDFTDMLNLWFANKLWDVQNGADQQLPDVLVQDNVKPDTWQPRADWQTATDMTPLYLEKNTLTPAPTHELADPISFSDQLPEMVFKNYVAKPADWEQDLLTDDHTSSLHGHRLVFKTIPFAEATTIGGVATLHVRVAGSQSIGMLSVQLVDYGEAKRLNASPSLLARKVIELGYRFSQDDLRDFTLADHPTPFKMITKGHLNLQNRDSNALVSPLEPDQTYDVAIPLQPTIYTLPAGHQLGLVIYATDFGMTIRGNQDLVYTVDLDETHLDLPID